MKKGLSKKIAMGLALFSVVGMQSAQAEDPANIVIGTNGTVSPTTWSGNNYVGVDGSVSSIAEDVISKISASGNGFGGYVYGVGMVSGSSLQLYSLKNGIELDVDYPVYGIYLEDSQNAKTLTVKKLGDIKSSSTAHSFGANGIYLAGGTLDIEFSEGKSIQVTNKSSGKAYGIQLNGGSATISNLGKIETTVTQEGNSSPAVGIYSWGAGTYKISFDGNGSITTKSEDGMSVGILSSAGNTTISGLKTITATSTSGSAFAIRVLGGTLVLQDKGITAKGIVSVGSSGTLQFDLPEGIAADDTVLYDTEYVTTGAVTLKGVLQVDDSNLADDATITLIRGSSIELDNITYKCKHSSTEEFAVADEGVFTLMNDGLGQLLTYTKITGVSLIPGEVSNNIVEVTGSQEATVNGEPCSKTPTGTKTWKDVYGGYSKDSGAVVQNNKLIIQDGTISGNVYAGYAPNGTTTNNTLTWAGGTIKGSTIEGNEITITGTDAKYLGSKGTINAEGLVNMTGTLTVGDGTNASKLTFFSGLNIAGGELVTNSNANVILSGESNMATNIESTMQGTISGTGTLTIGEKATLSTTGGKITTAIDGDGKLVVKSGTLVYEPASTTAKINVPVTIEAGATLDPDAGSFTKAVTNNGTLELSGGALGTTVTNKLGSTLKITDAVTISTGGTMSFVSGSTIELKASDFLTTAAIQGVTEDNFTITDSATVKLTGETDDDAVYMILAGDGAALDTLEDKMNFIGDEGEFTEVDTEVSGDVLTVKVSNLTADEMNINSFAGVQQGMVTMQNMTVDAVEGHLGLANKAQGAGKYDKDIWASYLHNKDSVDGFNNANYDAQYNGVTVGADFYTSEKVIAGVALTYATGNNDGYGIKSAIRNDSKYYGVELYERLDLKGSALLMDLGYMHGKNETEVTYKSITADAKVDSYTVGVRWEKDIQLKGSKLVPFAGVRYLRLKTDDYGSSRGLNYSTDSQNLFQPKVGIAWTGEYKMSKSSWVAKPKAEIGYIWALGDREAETGLTYKGKDKGNILYDVTDKSSYYAKLGVEFKKKNFAAGVDYSYMKGDSVRSNRWNINANWSF